MCTTTTISTEFKHATISKEYNDNQSPLRPLARARRLIIQENFLKVL